MKRCKDCKQKTTMKDIIKKLWDKWRLKWCKDCMFDNKPYYRDLFGKPDQGAGCQFYNPCWHPWKPKPYYIRKWWKIGRPK